MKTFKKSIAAALTVGLLLSGAVGVVAASAVAPMTFGSDKVVESKQEVLAGESAAKTVYSIKAGDAIVLTQSPEFKGNVLAIRVEEVGTVEKEVVFYDRGTDWGKAGDPAIAPVTITFGSLKTAEGKLVELGKANAVYCLIIDVLDFAGSAEGEYYASMAYFRVVLAPKGEAPTTPAAAKPKAPTTKPTNPADFPPHGDPIYASQPHDGAEEGPFGKVEGYIYISGYGYVEDNGEGANYQGQGTGLEDMTDGEIIE